MGAAELLLHPIRLRIVQAMLGMPAVTTTELREALLDVPVATLYRQVAMLAEGGVLVVVDERRVRGAVERTYELRFPGTQPAAAELRTMAAEDHRLAFMTFLIALLRDFDGYLGRGDIDFGRDGLGYTYTGLWLSDAEFSKFANSFAQAVIPSLENGVEPGRTRRVLSTIVMPVPSET